MKKFLALLILAATLILAACENVEYLESSIPEETSTDIYEDLNSRLPAPDVSDGEVVKKRPFTIVTNDSTAFYQDETTAGTISRALEERNTFLRDKYGAEITVKQVTSDELASDLANAVLSGLDYCDMISVSAEDTVKLYAAGLLEDMNTLPDFNVESGYFDEELSKALATNNSLYMLADPTALVYDETYVMYFNRDVIVLPEGGEEVEDLVMQGKWTWDKFDEYSRLAAADVYSHSSADIGSDIFAFGAYYTETVYPLTMWTSCGHKLIDNTYKNAVSVSMESEEIITIADFLMYIYNVRGKYPLEGEDARYAFEDGKLAFFCNKLSYIYALRDGSDTGSNFGFLPMPKYNEEQSEYYCLASNDARVISVPKTLTNADESKRKFVSQVISATCAVGGNTIRDAYINSQLALYLNSNEETVMLQTICNSVTFDFATVYGSSIEIIARPTINAIADYLDYGSKLSSSLRQGKKTFEEYCAENFT